jgi:predicted membrane protein
MNEKINTSLHSISLVAAFGLATWYFYAGDVSLPMVLTVLIITVAIIEVLSLILIAKVYPESHTQFKIGIIAALIILLGIKTMAPSFFASLTITVIAIDFLYNFYANTKRKKGAFKRKSKKKLTF